MAFDLHLRSYFIEHQSFTLFEPDKEAITTSYQKGEIDFPYWSQVCPAAIGLAQFILRNTVFISGKKVLELAAGLGLPSLVAAASGAITVTTSDYINEALAAMQQSITYNGLTNMQVLALDWAALPTGISAEILLLSDVSYDEKLFALQEKTIRLFLEQGTTVIISTPQRLIAKQAVAPLLPFCTQQEEVVVMHQHQNVAISIFVLHQ